MKTIHKIPSGPDDPKDQPIDLAGHLWNNWSNDRGQPPVVLNRAASVHHCIAWAWGEALQIEDIAYAAVASGDDGVAIAMANILVSKAKALALVLGEVGERTRNLKDTVGSAPCETK